MNITRVTIASFSPTGTTKRTLRAIAEGFGCSELTEIDWTEPESRADILKCGPDEVVIAGMLVYYGRIPSPFHKGLPLRGQGTPFVPVAVYGNRHYDDAVLELKTPPTSPSCAASAARCGPRPTASTARSRRSTCPDTRPTGNTSPRRSRPRCSTPTPASAAVSAPADARSASSIPKPLP